MPYKVTKDTQACPVSRPWAVTTVSGPNAGHLHGCHPNQDAARAQQNALYANVKEAGMRLREGSYTLPDGRQVHYTDAETLALADDLYQYVEHDHKGSPTPDAVQLENIVRNLHSGKPLESSEWDILSDLKRRMGAAFDRWRRARPSGQTAQVPGGSGRIQEADGTASTTHKDLNTTGPHLIDSVLHDLAHTRQHISRLFDPDVQASLDSLRFNAEHALRHTESARDHASKLDKHLAKHGSDPKTHDQERQILNRMRESKAPPPPNLREASDEQHRCGTCQMFYAGSCWGFGNISVDRRWVCDRWYPDTSLVQIAEARGLLEHLREDGKPQVCVDFDGVIYDRSQETGGQDLTGQPWKGVKQGLAELAKRYRVVLLSARANSKAVRQWLDQHGLGEYVADVTNVKPAAVAYIDDRSLQFHDWTQTVRDLEIGSQSAYSSDVPGGKT